MFILVTLSVIKDSLQVRAENLGKFENQFQGSLCKPFLRNSILKKLKDGTMYFVFHIWYFVFLAFCLYPPWLVLPWPHEYQEIMEILCHQIEIGRKCAEHFHFIPLLSLSDELFFL